MSRLEYSPKVAINYDGSVIAALMKVKSEHYRISIWKNNNNNNNNYKLLSYPIVFRSLFTNCIALNLEGSKLIHTTTDNNITIYDLNQKKETNKLILHNTVITNLALSYDDKTLLSASPHERTRIWDINKPGGFIDRLLKGEGNHYSSDKDTLCVSVSDLIDFNFVVATGKKNGKLTIFKINDTYSQETSTFTEFQAFNNEITGLSIDKNGSLIVASSLNETIKVWKTDDILKESKITPLRELVYHANEINDISINANGNKLISGSNDKHVFITNPLDGSEIAKYVHKDSVTGVAISGDGNIIVSISINGEMKIHNLNSHKLLAYIDVKNLYDLDSTTFKPLESLRTAKKKNDSATIELLNNNKYTLKLKRFRIKNYKSIIDTNDVWLSEAGITIFAGKNESGKSSILEALRDFSVDRDISEEAKPLNTNDLEPQITLTFDIDKDCIKFLETSLQTTFEKVVIDYLLKKAFISITKNFNNEYFLETELIDYINDYFNKCYQQSYQKFSELIEVFNNESLFDDFKFTELPENGPNYVLQEYWLNIEAYLNNKDKHQAKGALRELNNIKKLITPFSNYFNEIDFIETLLKEIKQLLPKIVYFNVFDDLLEFEVPINQLEEKEVIRDFAHLANIDLAKLTNLDNLQKRRHYLSEKSAKISNEFKNDWIQDDINLVCGSEGEIILFGIEEKGKHILFRFEQRSKGFQWFLSFYIKLNASNSDDVILLIDEPGLYLHAKAQEDVLKVFEKLIQRNKSTQVLFSTHSPYLIDTNFLNRLRLVEKKDIEGTIVHNKYYKDADLDTLTPIITKIGLDITKSLSLTNNMNVLLEGISDYFYLQAMKYFLKPKSKSEIEKIAFIPCVGAQNVPNLASLMIGWGLDYIVILDNDKAGDNASTTLTKKLDVDTSKIIRVSNDSTDAIEDLFTLTDFNKYIIDDKSKESDGTKKNSDYVKGYDHVIKAKMFLEKVQKNHKQIILEDESLDNFIALYSNIVIGFKLDVQVDMLKP